MVRVYPGKRSDPATKIEGTKSFSLGLSQLGHPSVIKPNELAEAQNVMYTLNGVIEKRPGSKVIGAIRGSSTHLNVVKPIYNINGVDYFLRISNDGILQKYIWASNLWVDISGSPTFSDTKTAILQAWGKVYIVNDTDLFTSWDGTTFSTKVPIANPTVTPTVVLVDSGRIRNVSLNAAGTGYGVGNLLTITGGDGKATCTVSSIISATGAVTGVVVSANGTGYAIADGVATTVSAGGSGCKVNITGIDGTGSRKEYYRYAWQNAGGQTLSSGNAYLTGLPEKMDATSYVRVTVPAAPAGTTKTMIFRGGTSGDEVYLASIDSTLVEYLDKDFDDEDPLFKIPSTNTTAGMHFKDGIVCVYKDTIMGVTTELGIDTIVFSAGLDKIDSFGTADGAGFFDFKKGDGKGVTGLHEYQESLYIFKIDKIASWKFNESGSGNLSTISLASGAVSMDSIHAAGNDLRYWGVDGAMALGNEPNMTGIRTRVLSARADVIVSAINQAELTNICGVYYKNHSLWGLPQGLTGTGNSTVLSYNEKFTAWSEWFGLKPALFAKVTDPDNKERLFMADALSANVKELWTGRDDSGDAIVWRVSTKQFDANVSYKYKTYNRVYFVFGNVNGGSTRVTLTENGYTKQQPLALYASNTGSQGFGVDQWGSMEFGSSSGEADENSSGLNIRFANVGYKDLFSLQATFTNDGLLDNLQLMGMFIEYSESSLPLPSEFELQPAY